MFFNLFYIFITFSCESESSPLKAGDNKQVQRIMEGYMKSIHQLTKQFPQQVIEMQIEISAPIAKLEPVHTYRRRGPLPQIRPSIDVLKKRLKFPRHMMRTKNDSLSTTTMATTIPEVTISLTDSPTDSPTKETTTTKTEVPTITITTELETESTKAPIYLDDLKKAFEDFAKKHTSHKDCDHKLPSSKQPHYSSNSVSKPHNIQDIWQLIGKGVQVEYNVPKPTEDNLDWLQIKLSNEVK